MARLDWPPEANVSPIAGELAEFGRGVERTGGKDEAAAIMRAQPLACAAGPL